MRVSMQIDVGLSDSTFQQQLSFSTYVSDIFGPISLVEVVSFGVIRVILMPL